MADDALTPRQVADELGVTVRTVQRWISDGRLPARRVGGRLRVSRSSLATMTERTRGVDAARSANAPRPIRTLLIANRGEIASRVARTARELGIRVVGVAAPGDRPPDGADEVRAIGSYLDGEAIVDAARRAGADAIHPGYGFLAENPEFARAVAEAGITWVGPPADAIAAMGDKAAARRRASAHGVPVVPGYDGAEQDDATLAGAADRIGLPVLIKPSAGGGGKGMRVVRSATELPEALAGARREAERAFGDDRLILERFIQGARHVEVQVLYDVGGAGVHLGERDCSAQRRNQKIVEEAPAPSVSEPMRGALAAGALAVAESVGYASAGTVEFLLAGEEFFFVEMNTRLQVEHAVTEAVTGRDLVADQLRIAGGATLTELGLAGPPHQPKGHAIEARLYAEDPAAGFLPATGPVALLRWPDGVRIDTGITVGDEVTDRYDPMIAKLVAHGATRAEALDRLRAALDETLVLGVRTNLSFLRWLLDRPEMASGDMRTDTIAGLDVPDSPRPADRHWQAAAALLLRATAADPWAGGWRLNAPPRVRLVQDGLERAVDADPRLDPPPAAAAGDAVHVDVDGQSLAFSLARPAAVEEAARHAAATGEAGASVLAAPMPGRVIAIRAEAGSRVEAHQPVVVIEAMKMEHAVTAPAAGMLDRVLVREGQQVERGEVLAELSALP